TRPIQVEMKKWSSVPLLPLSDLWPLIQIQSQLGLNWQSIELNGANLQRLTKQPSDWYHGTRIALKATSLLLMFFDMPVIWKDPLVSVTLHWLWIRATINFVRVRCHLLSRERSREQKNFCNWTAVQSGRLIPCHNYYCVRIKSRRLGRLQKPCLPTHDIAVI